MAIFKCKMCGGALEISNNETVVECDYCGAQQTIPKLDDDRRANLYDRANHFRRNNEFDKAMGIYEQILNEDNTDAEAYWSLVLCRYGIEYVEDPSTHKRVPTVNRAQFTSIFDDDNYKSALQNADSYQKAIYEAEAKAINEIQKGILAISQKEDPFDVFICYKETDNAGRRTPDSVLANDLYHQLTQEGFKVFFARITLEDKLGSAYEPYIFAALNSAKVMVALGTKPEYFNAVWVKNEWSRYLSLIKNGAKKMLIPAYKDMDPYDLPDEFSHLQAQDMSKLGFMQDLIRGIKKIIDAQAPKVTVVKETVVTGGNSNTAPLLKRVFMFLEDKEWDSADEYCEKVLDIDPECAEAYLGKLMVELKVTSRPKLKDCATPFDGKNNFQKAMRFASDNLKKELQGYIDFIVDRNLTTAYNQAVQAMRSAQNEAAYKKAAAQFRTLRGFKDSAELAKKCVEEAEQARLLALYNSAVSAMKSAETEKQFTAAANQFTKIGTFRDSKTLAAECLNRAETARLTALYDSAVSVMNSAKTEQQYKTAAEQFEAIKAFKDAQEQYTACLESAEASRKNAIYSAGIVLMNNRVKRIEDFQAAIEEFQKIYGWKDADDKIVECQDLITKINVEEFEREQQRERDRLARIAAEKKRKTRNIIIAICTAVLAMAGVFAYFLVTVIIPDNNYNAAYSLMEQGQYEEAIVAFEALNGYKDSAEQIVACEQGILQNKYDSGISLLEEGKYEEAYAIFECLGDFSDSKEQCKEARYQLALTYWDKKEYETSDPIFQELGSYKDSKQKIHKHEYATEVLTAPGCETKGEEKLTCTSCPHTYTQAVNATGHSYGQMQVTKAATCTAAGEKKSVCSTCGKAVTETIAMLAHSYSSKITKAATCEADGIKTFSCKCGKSYTETIEATGHNYSEVTCTTASACANCSHIRQAALGHDNKDNRCTRCNKNLTGVFTIVLDGMGGANGYVNLSNNYKPAFGTYRCTITVLEIDNYFETAQYYQDVFLPSIRAKANRYGDFNRTHPDVYAGAVFTFNIEVTQDYAYSITAKYCKIDVKIEPID